MKSKYDGIFKDFIFSQRCIISRDGMNVIWTCNGLTSFGDYHASRSFITGLSFWDRWLLWREYKREAKRRLLRFHDSDTDRMLGKIKIKI